jgi:hypothetical protein
MPPIDEQLNKINSTIDEINGGAKERGMATLPNVPITSDALDQTTPEFSLPDQNERVSTPTVDSVQSEVATDTAFDQRVAQDRIAAEKKATDSFKDQLEGILDAPTEADLQVEAQEKFGADEKQLAVDRFSTQLLAEQDRLRKAKEDLQAKGGGLSIGAQSEVANMERDSLRKQSDIAILKMAAQDELDFAQTQTNRWVDAMFERQEKVNEVNDKIVERNQDLFDQAELREYELMKDNRDRALDQEKENEKLLRNTKIEAMKMAQLNNAPQSVLNAIQSSDTPEGVIDVAGQYGSVDMLDRQVKLASLNNARLSGKKAQMEIDLLSNPPQELIPSQTLEKINDLSDGKREDLTNSRQTISEIDRMIEIVNSTDDITTLTNRTVLGREFNKLADNVADKLARERTGAVVGKEEEKTFKRILGVGAFNQISASDAEVTQALNNMKGSHTENLSLIDPTGEISTFLEAQSLKNTAKKDDKEADVYWGVSVPEDSTFNPAKHF